MSSNEREDFENICPEQNIISEPQLDYKLRDKKSIRTEAEIFAATEVIENAPTIKNQDSERLNANNKNVCNLTPTNNNVPNDYPHVPVTSQSNVNSTDNRHSKKERNSKIPVLSSGNKNNSVNSNVPCTPPLKLSAEPTATTSKSTAASCVTSPLSVTELCNSPSANVKEISSRERDHYQQQHQQHQQMIPVDDTNTNSIYSSNNNKLDTKSITSSTSDHSSNNYLNSPSNNDNNINKDLNSTFGTEEYQSITSDLSEDSYIDYNFKYRKSSHYKAATIAEPFILRTGIRASRRGSDDMSTRTHTTQQSLSLAEIIQQFENDPRSHDNPRAHLTTTKPLDIKLATEERAKSAKRIRPPAMSTEEIRLLEDQQELAYTFKARPFLQRIFDESGKIGVPKATPKPVTESKEFHFFTLDRVEKRAIKLADSPTDSAIPVYKARPIPAFYKRTSDTATSTSTATGSGTGEDHQQSGAVKEEESKASRVAKYKRSASAPPRRSIAVVKEVPKPANVPNVPTVIKAFHLRTTERGLAYQTALAQKVEKELAELREASRVKALPLPPSHHSFTPVVPKREPSTHFEEFHLRSADRHKQASAAFLHELNSEARRERAERQFRARQLPPTTYQPELIVSPPRNNSKQKKLMEDGTMRSNSNNASHGMGFTSIGRTDSSTSLQDLDTVTASIPAHVTATVTVTSTASAAMTASITSTMMTVEDTNSTEIYESGAGGVAASAIDTQNKNSVANTVMPVALNSDKTTTGEQEPKRVEQPRKLEQLKQRLEELKRLEVPRKMDVNKILETKILSGNKGSTSPYESGNEKDYQDALTSAATVTSVSTDSASLRQTQKFVSNKSLFSSAFIPPPPFPEVISPYVIAAATKHEESPLWEEY